MLRFSPIFEEWGSPVVRCIRPSPGEGLHWGMYDFYTQKDVSQYRTAYRSSLSPESGEGCPQDGMRAGTSKPPISQTLPIHTPISLVKG